MVWWEQACWPHSCLTEHNCCVSRHAGVLITSLNLAISQPPLVMVCHDVHIYICVYIYFCMCLYIYTHIEGVYISSLCQRMKCSYSPRRPIDLGTLYLLLTDTPKMHLSFNCEGLVTLPSCFKCMSLPTILTMLLRKTSTMTMHGCILLVHW